MKKFLCMAMSLLMLAGLAGCSASGGYQTAPTGAANSTAAGDYSAEGWYGEEGAAPGEEWRYEEIEPEEEYDHSPETPFKDVMTSPLSTFSSDVDTASYSNMRRFITAGQKPEGVRIEELVNYFDYDYPRPASGAEHPFTVSTELAACPWNSAHLLAMVGVQGAELENSGDMANNIVFLLDVSGSMSDENKLPLLQKSFKLMLDKLGRNDVVSIVTYAGNERVVADSIRGDQHRKLARLIDSLESGGSTAGAKGLQTAYDLADKNFIEDGNNRIILATDGDFNVGPSSEEALQEMVERERERGVFISVLGFGMYNLKDNRMETIADCGNGNYAYIDTLDEARKVLVDEFDSTMYTIAKDLKFQVEFNPETVAQYRLIGYNNRRLENEDFANDKKDAGDVGAGHSVTAFYEIVPAGAAGEDDSGLRYQQSESTGSTDFMNVKIRYKAPTSDESTLFEQAVPAGALREEPSREFGFAAAVAEFGLILTDSEYKGGSSVGAVLQNARACRGEDPYGLRGEFVELVRQYAELDD